MSIVSEKIKTLCSDRNITKEQLSERSGLSLEKIELIENGEKIPSLSSLIKISRALGVRLGTFLDDSENIGPVVHRKSEKSESATFSSHLSTANSHMDFFSLAASKAARNMEPFLINIHKNEDAKKVSSSHEGEEFIYVLKGTVNIDYGKEKYVLQSGDSLYYDSIVEHLVYTESDEGAQILAVVYSPF